MSRGLKGVFVDVDRINFFGYQSARRVGPRETFHELTNSDDRDALTSVENPRRDLRFSNGRIVPAPQAEVDQERIDAQRRAELERYDNSNLFEALIEELEASGIDNTLSDRVRTRLENIARSGP